MPCLSVLVFQHFIYILLIKTAVNAVHLPKLLSASEVYNYTYLIANSVAGIAKVISMTMSHPIYKIAGINRIMATNVYLIINLLQ